MARPIRMAECHPERKHKARGLCAPCYATAWEAGRVPAKSRVKATCHPDRTHKGRGLCSSCYKAARLRGDFGEVKPQKVAGAATCHPDRKHAAKGLCRPCYDRIRNRMSLYGLTPEESLRLQAKSGGKCMICQVPSDRLVVDHCHQSGVVRGLLCGRCNTQLGVIEKRGPEWLEEALKYLDGDPTIAGSRPDQHDPMWVMG